MLGDHFSRKDRSYRMSQQNWEWTLLPPKSICPSNCKTKVVFFVPPMIIALLFSLFGHRTTTATKKSVIPVLYRLIMISMCWCQLLNKAENKALISYGTYTTQIVYLYFPDKTERFTVSHATSLRLKIHSKLSWGISHNTPSFMIATWS